MSLCLVCDRDFAFAWTDTHGVGQCTTCGAPYRIYHYENDKRVEKPPLFVLADAMIAALRKFHADTRARLSAQSMGLSFPGGFDIARQEDADALERWISENRELWASATAREAA